MKLSVQTLVKCGQSAPPDQVGNCTSKSEGTYMPQLECMPYSKRSEMCSRGLHIFHRSSLGDGPIFRCMEGVHINPVWKEQVLREPIKTLGSPFYQTRAQLHMM